MQATAGGNGHNLGSEATAAAEVAKGATRRSSSGTLLLALAPSARDVGKEEHTVAQERIAIAGRQRAALVVAVLGFFVVTLDALVVNVALPAIGYDLGGGITGLQWVIDGYTLMFAALLLSAGALSDRIGARQAYGAGLALFVAASTACGLAPQMGVFVAARLAQGAGAAIMLPTTLALIREA